MSNFWGSLHFSSVNVFILWFILSPVITNLPTSLQTKNLILCFTIIATYVIQIGLNVRTKYVNPDKSRYIFISIYVCSLLMLAQIILKPNSLNIRVVQFILTTAILDIMVRLTSITVELLSLMENDEYFSKIKFFIWLLLSMPTFFVVFLAENQNAFFSFLVIVNGMLLILLDNKYRKYLMLPTQKNSDLYLLLVTFSGVLEASLNFLLKYTYLKKKVDIHTLLIDLKSFYRGKQLLPLFYVDALYTLVKVSALCLFLVFIAVIILLIVNKKMRTRLKSALHI